MTLGAAMHRTSLEVINGEPIDSEADDLKVSNSSEQGSAELRFALRQQFIRFAARHGVTLEDARLCCMNSWEPQQ